MRLLTTLLFLVALAPLSAWAAVYECAVARKLDRDAVYTNEQLEESKFSVLIEELQGSAYLSRCSVELSTRQKTCDRYAVDRIETDSAIGSKKFYVFRSMFDVQLFADLSMVENNGRGSIAFGACKAKAQ